MRALIFGMLFAFGMLIPSHAKDVGRTDDQIANILIQQSISNYSGNCPCPYNTASDGSSCGKRSAYSKSGGAEPLCYRRDVTPVMIKRYRAS